MTKRAICLGRVASYRAKQPEEVRIAADAQGILANLVMDWNRIMMQEILDRWSARRSTSVAPKLIGRIAATCTDGINPPEVFSLPIEQYAEQLLPSLSVSNSRVAAAS